MQFSDNRIKDIEFVREKRTSCRLSLTSLFYVDMIDDHCRITKRDLFRSTL